MCADKMRCKQFYCTLRVSEVTDTLPQMAKSAAAPNTTSGPTAPIAKPPRDRLEFLKNIQNLLKNDSFGVSDML